MAPRLGLLHSKIFFQFLTTCPKDVHVQEAAQGQEVGRDHPSGDNILQQETTDTMNESTMMEGEEVMIDMNIMTVVDIMIQELHRHTIRPGNENMMS